MNERKLQESAATRELVNNRVKEARHYAEALRLTLPTYAAMLNRYSNLLECLWFADANDEEKKKLLEELKGFEKWIGKSNGTSDDEALYALSDMLRDAGYLNVAERASHLKELKGKSGRPREISGAETACALELFYLHNQTYCQIADFIPHGNCESGKPHRDDYEKGTTGRVKIGENKCAGRFRDHVEQLRNFLVDQGWEFPAAHDRK